MTTATPVRRRSAAVPVSVELALRSLAERRRLVISLTVSSFLLAAMVAALYSSIGTEFDAVLDGLPSAVESMLGGADFGTAEGFLQVELFSFMGPALAIGAGVGMGAGALAGAEESGRLALVTTSAITRRQVVGAATLATTMSVTAATSGMFGGILTGGVVGDLGVDPGRVLAACCSLWLLGVAAGMVALAVGAATGRRGSAVGGASLAAVVSYAVYTFLPLSDRLAPLARVSLWHPYAAGQPLVNGLDPIHMAVLAGSAVVLHVAAVWVFDRRDLRS